MLHNRDRDNNRFHTVTLQTQIKTAAENYAQHYKRLTTTTKTTTTTTPTSQCKSDDEQTDASATVAKTHKAENRGFGLRLQHREANARQEGILDVDVNVVGARENNPQITIPAILIAQHSSPAIRLMDDPTTHITPTSCY